MNRPVILTLRVLAIGSALTAITCQVANRQQLANAAAGDPGAPGPAAPPSTPRPTWAPSSKSLDSLIVPTRPPVEGVPATIPVPPKQAVTPAVKEEVRRIFSRGLGFYDLGHFEDAEVEFKSILAIDPQNAAAARALERVQSKSSPKPAAGPSQPAPAAPPPPARPAAPRYFPGSKSAAIVSPADVRQMQQRITPATNQAPAQQSANPRR